VKKSHRKFIVFSTLLGVLTLTSALLMALAPAPLVPDAATSLFAVDEPRSMDAIFVTKAPLVPSHWRTIYIHHTQTPAGNALTLGQGTDGLGDHFIIGNGDGLLDGEIQVSQRWNQQQPARAPAANVAGTVDQSFISIGLIGDFDKTVPTPTQLRRLSQLVGALQGELHVAGSNVVVIESPKSPAGIGRYFPKTAFRGQLLP
jgi:hypothetical protein